jgi:hypothetical protein
MEATLQQSRAKPGEQVGVHIFIDKVRYDFTVATSTGRELKERAGAKLTDGLYLKEHGRLVEVLNHQVIDLKNGQHFSIVPDGSVS